MIKHENIFYVRNIHEIGGVETFVYELAKKYQDYDIAVVCKTIAPQQLERLKKFCRVYVHTNEPIECKVIITNWDTTILEFVNDEAKKYTVLHTDYSNPTEILGLPKDRKDITYIGITEDSKKKFEDITGIDRTILCRNPLQIEEDEPMLTLVSATRLTKIKDDGRHLKLAQALEKQNIKFIWYIFTTDEYNTNPLWDNENIVHMKNRLELGQFLKKADWYVQLSSCEGDSYSLKEALYRGTPIVVCELPYFKEIGIENNKNALFLNLDCSNVEEVVEKMKKPLKFKFQPVKDGYDDIVIAGKSKYKEELKMKVKVQCIKNYFDTQLKETITPENKPFMVNSVRAEELVKAGVCELVEKLEEPKEELKEETVQEPVKEVKEKKTTRRKK